MDAPANHPQNAEQNYTSTQGIPKDHNEAMEQDANAPSQEWVPVDPLGIGGTVLVVPSDELSAPNVFLQRLVAELP